jgi:hypothetical protein
MTKAIANRSWARAGRLGVTAGVLGLAACNALLGIDEASVEPQGGDAGAGGTASGSAGGAGMSGMATKPPPCTADQNCVAPATTPPSCATARCDTAQGVCVYTAVDRDQDSHAAADCRANNGVAIALGDDCDDDDPLFYPGQSAACSELPNGQAIAFPGGAPKGLCRAGTKACLPDGKAGPCQGAVAPAAEDCATTAEDEDCDGSSNNGCSCSPLGATLPCNAHPGLDDVGACRAGSQSCVAGPEPGTNVYSACSGDVGPGADECEADGPDLDCDGVRGNGASCFKNLYVYVSTASYSCSLASPDRPLIYQADQDDTAGVPGGYTLLTQFKIFREASGSKTAIYRCFNAAEGYYFTGYSGCTDSETQRLLGYVSNVDGGNGWVALAEFFGRDFGPTGTMRSDVPQCCPDNCNVAQRFVLQ